MQIEIAAIQLSYDSDDFEPVLLASETAADLVQKVKDHLKGTPLLDPEYTEQRAFDQLETARTYTDIENWFSNWADQFNVHFQTAYL